MVPVTISGARRLLPPKGFPSLDYGDLLITVHAPIESKVGVDRAALRAASVASFRRWRVALCLSACVFLCVYVPVSVSVPV